MALDFDKLIAEAKKDADIAIRNNGGKNYVGQKRAYEANPKDTLPTKDTKTTAKTQSKTTKKTTKGNTRHKLTDTSKERLEKEAATNAVPQFMMGMTYAMANNSPAGIVHSIATGKKLAEPTETQKKYGADKSFAYKAGNFTGTAVSYATPYKFGEKAITKGAGKVIGSKVGQKAVGKLVGSKVGQKVGESAIKGVTEGIVKNTIGDATIGTVMNLGMARGEGLKGKELAKDMGVNALLDFGIGGAMEATPIVKKGLKAGMDRVGDAIGNTKLGKSLSAMNDAHKTLSNQGEIADIIGNHKAYDISKNAELPTKPKVDVSPKPVEQSVEQSVDLPTKVATDERLASQSDGTLSIVNTKRRDENIKQFANFSNGNMKSGEYFDFGETPQICVKYGAKQRPLKMTQSTLEKIVYPPGYQGIKHGHNLGFEGLEQALEQLHDPLMILKSNTQENSQILITRVIDSANNPVIVPLHLDANGNIETINKIASMYGKQNAEGFIERAVKSGDVIYMKNGTDLSSVEWLQLPKADSKSDPMNILYDDISNVKNNALKPNGADIAREPKTIDEVRKQYGTYGNEAETPLRTDYGKVTQGAATISDSLPEDKRKVVEEGIRIGDYFTKETHNKDFQSKAREEIAKNIDDTYKKFYESKGRLTGDSENIIRGIELGNEYARRGMYDKMEEVFSDVAGMASEAGRTLQAMRLFNSLSPQGRMRSVTNAVKKLGKKRGVDIEIPDKLYDALKNATTDKELNEVRKNIFDEAWKQIPGSWQEKVDAFRYLSMLGNPKTHIRNILGNALYVPVRVMDDVFTSVFEKVFSKQISKMGGRKTVAYVGFSKEDKELRKFAKEKFEELSEVMMGDSSKYMDRVRPQDSKVFSTKTLNFLNSLNSSALEFEDKVFMGDAFRDAFSKYCKANGKTVDNMSEAFIKEASEYAQEKALKATYRDPDQIADALSRLRKRLNTNVNDQTGMKIAKTLGGIAMDSALPFKKTPINILKRAVEHTPLAMVDGIAKIARAKDANTLRQGIELLSEGLTGTGIMVVGALLGEKGWVNGSLGEYGKERSFEELQGKQDYAINIGGTSITADWIAPMSMPFFVGVELGQNLFFKDDESNEFWDTLDAFSRMADPIFEMSMLSGIENVAKAMTSNDDKTAIINFTSGSIQNLVSQFLPTIGGQLARTITPNRKTTLSTAENQSQKKIEKFSQKMANKVPFLTETSPDYVDMWGRTETKETTGDYLKAGLENFLSPAYISSDKSTFVDKKLKELSRDIELDEILPQNQYSYDVAFNGKTHRMSNEEFTRYKKTVGQTAYKGLDKLFRTSEFNKMTDKEKKSAINKVYNDAKEKAKEQYLLDSGKVTKRELALSKLPTKSQENVTKSKLDPVRTLEAYDTAKKSGASTEIGKASSLVRKYDVKTLKALGYTEEQITKAQMLDKVGIKPKEFDKAKRTAQSLDPNGSPTNVSKAEAIAYINKQNLTREQKYALYAALMPQSKPHTNPYR